MRHLFYIILVIATCNFVLSCKYKVYDYRLNSVKNSKTFLAVNYQYPNGPSYIIYRNDEQVQEVFMNDNLGGNIEKYNEPNGIVLKGNGIEIRFMLEVDETEFVEFRIHRELIGNASARDCLSFGNQTNWYGGPEQKSQQLWPIESQKYTEYSYVTKENSANAISERYWLSSKGIFFYVSFETPLFITQTPNEMLCFITQKKLPYSLASNRIVADYYIGIGSNPKEAHLKAIKLHLNKPSSIPDETMVNYPIWSTWARYKRQINEEIVETFAKEIQDYNFKSSQLEIDDDWEECYGSLTINKSKFPDMKSFVEKLKNMGYRVTIWIHPFINKNCQPWYNDAISKQYVVFNQNGNPDTSWWNSIRNRAAYIDFTNPEASKWFIDRLQALKDNYGIDSFKFDAGETSWAPSNPKLKGDPKYHPNILTKLFVEEVSKFGGMIEVRTGWGTQNLPVFVRMLDKDSTWSIKNNGLESLVTTLLQMNMNGYPFVLPDMVGGNGYIRKPDKELFLRWLEANVFMPTIQYSYVPWDYDSETIKIASSLTELHEKIAAPIIIEAMKKSVQDGTPVNSPIWWIDPNDRQAHAIGDEFLLGETVLVAPILAPNITSRHIYLPEGTWRDIDGTLYNKGWITDYPAPLGTIPYFILEKENAKTEL